MFSFAKKIRLAAFVAAALLPWQGLSGVALHAQEESARAKFTQKDFVGTWNLMFQDKRFATLTLQPNGDQLAGTMTNGSIDMDDNGKITSAVGREGTSPIVRTSFADGV